MKTHHLEYGEGGILDMDDMLSDLVEDRDKVRSGILFRHLFGPEASFICPFFFVLISQVSF